MANDPIFWLYHCNIDRSWASWNQAGGHNPTDDGFLGQTFTFVDENGKPLQSKVADVLYTGPLGYVYDRYLDRPPDSAPFLMDPGYTSPSTPPLAAFTSKNPQPSSFSRDLLQSDSSTECPPHIEFCRNLLEGETNPGGEAVVGGVVYPENGIVIDVGRTIAGKRQRSADPKVKIVPRSRGAWQYEARKNRSRIIAVCD